MIAFGSPKEAALYFDQVMPLDFSLPALSKFVRDQGLEGWEFFEELTELEVPLDVAQCNRVLQSLSRGDERISKGYANLIPLNVCPWVGVTVNAFDDDDQRRKSVREIINRAGIDFDDFTAWVEEENGISLDAYFARYKNQFDAVLNDAGLENASTWSGRFAPFILRSKGRVSERGFAVALHDLEMIDVSKLTWEQIIAFRDDPDHMRSLRDFRLYFHENDFEKAEPGYVRDRLEQAIEQQKLSAKFWGFETAKQTFAVAANKGNLALSGMAGLASALAGAPIAIAAIAGTVVTTASCAFEFSQIYIDERKARLNRPLRFLTRLDKLTDDASRI